MGLNNQKYTVQDLRDKDMILLEYISGSQMYGTNNEKSDVDIKGIFLMPESDFADYNYSPEWEEVESGKFIREDGKECEMKFIELRKFLQLLQKNNPNMLEVFNIPQDCLISKHNLMEQILNDSHKFLSKKAYYSFSGYAMDQTSKAHGQNKKQNWEKDRFERRDILDFCHVPWKQGSVPLKKWMELNNFPPDHIKNFVLNRIPHMNWCFGLYVKPGGKGIVREDGKSTALRVDEIPKDSAPIATVFYNEGAWMKHCEEYRSYQTWLKERNEARWVDVKAHDQKIDGKNMLHMQRLINMAKDIAEGKGIITRRPEAQDLLKIRKGEVPLQELLDACKTKIAELKILFDKSNLPDDVDPAVCAEFNSEIRKSVIFAGKNNKMVPIKKIPVY